MDVCICLSAFLFVCLHFCLSVFQEQSDLLVIKTNPRPEVLKSSWFNLSLPSYGCVPSVCLHLCVCLVCLTALSLSPSAERFVSGELTMVVAADVCLSVCLSV